MTRLTLAKATLLDIGSGPYASQEVYLAREQGQSEFLEIICQRAELILNCGAGPTRFNKWLEPHAYRFKQKRFLAFDIVPSIHLDWCGNLEKIPLRDGSVDAVICWSVLEHVFEPQRCVEEMHRVLVRGGVGLFHLPMWFPAHGKVDCYRFALDGLLYCFRHFQRVFVKPQDDYSGVLARTLFGYSKSRYSLMLQTLVRLVASGGAWLVRGRGLNPMSNTSGWVVLAQK